MANTKTLKPEILTHPNIPKPLHGIAPRIVKGKVWWDIERRKCYEKAGQMCECCGTPREHAWPNRWLEAHETYEYKYGIFTFVGVVCLCPACHKFIHSGLTQLLFERGELSLDTYERIRKHGHYILKQNGLTEKWKERHNYVCPEWKDFRMCIDGKYYGPSSRNLLSWKMGEWKKWEPKPNAR